MHKPIGGFFELENDLSGSGSLHPDGLFLNTGRACLNLILKTVKPSKIFVPYYTCDALLDPIYLHSIPFEFYALNEMLDPIELPDLAPSECFLYIDYFGLKSKTTAQLRKKYTTQLIVDNSQAFFFKGNRNYYSFNSARKVAGVPDGAYVYGDIPRREFEVNEKFRTDYLELRSRGMQREAFNAFRDYEKSLDSEIRLGSTYSNSILKTLNYVNIVAARKRNFNTYHRLLKGDNRFAVNLAGISDYDVPFCYPLFLNKVPKIELLYDKNIFVPVFWTEVLSRVKDGFSFEKEFTSRTLPLPIDHRYRTEDIYGFVSQVKEFDTRLVVESYTRDVKYDIDMPNQELTEKLRSEKEFLNKIYSEYTLHNDPQTRVMREFAFKVVEPFIKKEGVGLELGCSDGYFTEMLAAKIHRLDVIDGSVNFIEQARKRGLPNVTYTHSLFEEFNPPSEYDYVFASYIMEHVLEPSLVFDMVKKILKPNGIFYIVVPNARALSRQLAMHMGLYKDLKQLTENDLKFGHRRVYDRVSLNKDIENSGFVNISQGGLMLKILADFQMDRLIAEGILQDAQLNGLFKLGLEYPDLCGSLFSICKIKA